MLGHGRTHVDLRVQQPLHLQAVHQSDRRASDALSRGVGPHVALALCRSYAVDEHPDDDGVVAQHPFVRRMLGRRGLADHRGVEMHELAPALVQLRHMGQVLEIGPGTVAERRSRVGVRGVAVIEHRSEQRLLRGEVMGETGGRDAGGRCDLRHRGRGEALPGDEVDRRAQCRLAHHRRILAARAPGAPAHGSPVVSSSAHRSPRLIVLLGSRRPPAPGRRGTARTRCPVPAVPCQTPTISRRG